MVITRSICEINLLRSISFYNAARTFQLWITGDVYTVVGWVIPRPERSKVPSCNSYAGLYLIVFESPRGILTAGGGPGCCNCTSLPIELPIPLIGIGVSAASEMTWILEVTLERVVEGVNEVGGVAGVCDEAIRRAGLGNVLYVEPRDVYLHIDKLLVWMIDYRETLPLIIQGAIGNIKSTQERPNVRVRPVDNGVDTLERRPSWISHISMG